MAVSLPSERPRARLQVTAGVVDVWSVDLDAAPDGLQGLLCAQERARAAQIVQERNQVLWARSRGSLRALLGRYLQRDPRSLRFALGPYGKPELRETEPASGEREGSEPPAGLRFNLSHSREIMLVAVTVGREIGVDVECARERHTAKFLRTWTMREATVKCRGTGLGLQGVASVNGRPTWGDADGLWIAGLDLGPRATAAVAVEGSDECELRCWSSTPTLTP